MTFEKTGFRTSMIVESFDDELEYCGILDGWPTSSNRGDSFTTMVTKEPLAVVFQARIVSIERKVANFALFERTSETKAISKVLKTHNLLRQTQQILPIEQGGGYNSMLRQSWVSGRMESYRKRMELLFYRQKA